MALRSTFLAMTWSTGTYGRVMGRLCSHNAAFVQADCFVRPPSRGQKITSSWVVSRYQTEQLTVESVANGRPVRIVG
jgi:hypothetical protein